VGNGGEEPMFIRYMSVADASKVLGLTPGGVRLMARRKELEIAAMTEGGIQLFKRTHVEEVARKRSKAREQKKVRLSADVTQIETQKA
jgi:hypothetical protein